MFLQYISNKKRAKESLHPVLNAGGNIDNKDEEQTEALCAFFAPVFKYSDRLF